MAVLSLEEDEGSLTTFPIIFICPAFSPPIGEVDTLRAGDTFNDAIIGCLAGGLGLRRSVELGCQVGQSWGARWDRAGVPGGTELGLQQFRRLFFYRLLAGRWASGDLRGWLRRLRRLLRSH
jgi:hypothetical protein